MKHSGFYKSQIAKYDNYKKSTEIQILFNKLFSNVEVITNRKHKNAHQAI